MTTTVPEFANSMPALRRNAHDTNYEAAEKLFPRTGRYKHRLVTAHVSASGRGLTDFEAAAALGPRVKHSSAGATRISMNTDRDHGIPWFIKSDQRRANEDGNNCIVWQLTPEARQVLGVPW